MLPTPVFRIFIAALFLVGLCAATSDTSDESNASLWDMVPACARNCTENFITADYTRKECARTDIKCLCRTKTPTGLTLGDAAITCVYAVCSKEVQESSDAYKICKSVSGHITPTYSTLTATTFQSTLPGTTTTTTTSSTSSTTTTSDAKETTADTASSQTSTSTTSTEAPSVTSSPSSTAESGASPTITSDPQTATSTNTTAAAAAGASSDGGISPGVVIGVSVISGSAGCFIIGVAVFFCAKRWKKKNRVDSDSEVARDEFCHDPVNWGPAELSESSRSRRSSQMPDVGPTMLHSSPTRQELEVSQIQWPAQIVGPLSQYPPRFANGSGIRLVDSPRDEHNQRIGYAVTSNSDRGSPRMMNSRPQQSPVELPPMHTPGLYPRPLNLSQRPTSEATDFEDDDAEVVIEKKLPDLPSTRGGPKPGPSAHPGLPPNPRALKQGYRASQFRRPSAQRRYEERRAEPLPPQPQPQQPQSPPRPVPAGPRGLGPPFSAKSYRARASTTSNSSSGPNYSSGSSDHTSNTFATTPPFSAARPRLLTGTPPRRPQPPTPAPVPLAPPAEIISHPRIIRKGDIKRIEPGTSSRPPSEVVVPYCPEDLWLERGRSNAHSRSPSSELPYPSEALPGVVLYPSSPKKRPGEGPQRISPTSRNLTPSRRGDDLILSVD